jgi:hypothetical protein
VTDLPDLTALAHDTRQRFCSQVGAMLSDVCQDVLDHLNNQFDGTRSVRELQAAREAQTEFNLLSRAWIDGVCAALQQNLRQPSSAPEGYTVVAPLELLTIEAVEDQLLGSKLALSISEGVGQAWSDLRQRLLFADGRTEMLSTDVVRPETLGHIMLEEWMNAGLSRESWRLLTAVMHDSQGRRMLAAYEEANRFLVTNGVMPEIQLRHAIRKSSAVNTHRAADSGAAADPLGAPVPGSQPPSTLTPTARGGDTERVDSSHTEVWSKARHQAQELMGRLRRLLVDRGGEPEGAGDGVDTTIRRQPSAGLQAMLKESQLLGAARTGDEEAMRLSADMVGLVQQATDLVRQRSTELKQAAKTSSEKATIEVVALMFQSILAEDRIQPSLRAWFARLQIPVLRVALEDADFFSSMQHPARCLIDRMGSCALGFDAALSDGSTHTLEAEIRRIVQVVEQYPEAGHRVFQLVLDEFQNFLASHLQTQGPAGKLVTVAQQVEQKETLAVQYTIELRKLLNNVPVGHEIRDFLFKVWAEVLAVSSVKLGAKHTETALLKQTACDLLWAASAKPTRAERARVIHRLPGMLDHLRKGMALLGLDIPTQEANIKLLSNIIADAFMARTDSIPAAQLDEVTHKLSVLENFLPEDGVGDLELDQESIEMITGVDASNIEVITAGGTQAGKTSRGWAEELQLGAWFHLDHNESFHQVQLAWRSQRGQLCLFTTVHLRCFLMTATRVAAFLEAGLLVPAEKEPLTVRATRAAVQELEADPGRLLH